MPTLLILLAASLSPAVTLWREGAPERYVAENLMLKHQLLVMRRSRRRAPHLQPADRVLLGFLSRFLEPRRLVRSAVISETSHLAGLSHPLDDVSPKYRYLYSSHPKRKPGPKSPAPELSKPSVNLNTVTRALAAQDRAAPGQTFQSTSTKVWSVAFWPATTTRTAVRTDLPGLRSWVVREGQSVELWTCSVRIDPAQESLGFGRHGSV